MTPQEQAEELLAHLIPFAEKMLEENGEFFPFAGKVANDGDIYHVAGYDGEEQPPSNQIRQLLESGLRQEAERGECRLSVLVSNVNLVDSQTGETEDAIHAAIEHQEGYSVDVYFPYSLVDGALEMREPKAQERTPTVFPRDSTTRHHDDA